MPLCYAMLCYVGKYGKKFYSLVLINMCRNKKERFSNMAMDDLSINFPKQAPNTTYYLVGGRLGECRESVMGQHPVTVPEGKACVGYRSVNYNFDNGDHYYNTHLRTLDGGIQLAEYTEKNGKPLGKYQTLKTKNGVTIKDIKIAYDKHSPQDVYTATEIFDKPTERFSVVRKKGGEIIGGYEFAPMKRTFAKNGKARFLQKLGMAISSDWRGREIPVLQNLGERILKLATKIK